ncbi:hypothetical protein AVEN_108594-1 [Araneus ventricosus]|uniref:MADF domain-containing protein n=1 Tax=Araneus ventricosus TaxID=182803 RepID=A0A4Y2DIF7_ARAVE|nr:hypothetical protein AVEN_108594-1 [Araneus ventricosus]
MEYCLDSELMILEVEKYPYLYDSRHNDFKNHELKKDAWMAVTKNVIGEKWNQMDEKTRSNLENGTFWLPEAVLGNNGLGHLKTGRMVTLGIHQVSNAVLAKPFLAFSIDTGTSGCDTDSHDTDNRCTLLHRHKIFRHKKKLHGVRFGTKY